MIFLYHHSFKEPEATEIGSNSGTLNKDCCIFIILSILHFNNDKNKHYLQ